MTYPYGAFKSAAVANLDEDVGGIGPCRAMGPALLGRSGPNCLECRLWPQCLG
jgi:hypothetical protein